MKIMPNDPDMLEEYDFSQGEVGKYAKSTESGKRINPRVDDTETPEELDFDYSKARPNRFAERYKESNPLVVLLDPDVAEVFTTPEAVNKALRALILTSRQLLDSETLNPSFVNEKKGNYSS